ncbi:hypothetical protein CsatA_029963 [Cannabis sativa]
MLLGRLLESPSKCIPNAYSEDPYYFFLFGNDFLYHKRVSTPANLIQATTYFLDQYQQKNKQQISSRSILSSATSDSGNSSSTFQLKLSVDAAQNVTTNKTGFDMALYNSNGDLLLTVSTPWEGIQPALLMEAHALYYALSLCQKYSIKPYYIVSDCKRLVDYICNDATHNILLNRFAKNIKSLLSSLPNATFRHITRWDNEDAHRLAKYALGLDQEACWKDQNFLCNLHPVR